MVDQKEVVRLSEQANFLGYEFLTWLFLLLDSDDQEEIQSITKDLLHKTEVNIVLGERMNTCLLSQKAQKTSIASPLLQESHEVFASLKNGHQVESLALGVSFGEIIVFVSIHAHDFSLTQVKIKNNFDAESLSDDEHSLDEDERMREEIFLRMAAIDDVEKVIDALYGHYLKLKTASFSKVIEQMKRQIELRLGHYLKMDRSQASLVVEKHLS